MNLEEIMKPYFDKQDEIRNKYSTEKAFINLRLERIRENKEKEIEEYVQNALNERPNFYAGYGAVIRKDLEQSYAKTEENLKKELENIDKYRNVDTRELIDIKSTLRNKVISFKKDLELELREANVYYEKAMYDLAKFRYEYDENHRVLNGDEFRRLYAEVDRMTESKHKLSQNIKKCDEYLDLLQITKEEAAILMSSMNPVEMEEYNRRKALKAEKENIKLEENLPFKKEEEKDLSIEEQIDNIQLDEENEPLSVEEEVDNVTCEKEEENLNKELTLEEDLIDTSLDRIVRPSIENENDVVVESYKDLLSLIYSDIVDSSKNMRSVKLDPSKENLQNNGYDNGHYISTKDSDSEYQIKGAVDIPEDVKLTSGEYLNQDDILNALNNYRKQNKNRTFKIKEINKTFEITRKTINKVKKSLRDCSIVKLLSEKKLSQFDVKRVYGQENAGKYYVQTELAEIRTSLPEGDYINRNEFILNLKNIFAEKSQSWLDKLVSKINRRTQDDMFALNLSEEKEKAKIK